MIKIENPDGSSAEMPDATDYAKASGKALLDSLGIGALIDLFVVGPTAMVSGAIQGYVSLFELVISKLGEVYSKGQGLGTVGFYPLVATICSDLLGVPVDQTIADQSASPANRIPAARAVGSSLYNLLEGEFTDGNPLSEDQGKKAAEAFLGFLMQFAIREGNIAVLGDVKWIPWIDEFRSYGENMAKYLGLGRQARAALRPLIQTTIATPLQWNLNKQYRPTKLSESIFVHALNRGLIDQATFQTEMARLGYSDDYIKVIQHENERQLSDGEIIKLFHMGILSEQDTKTRLMHLGFTDVDVANYMQVQIPTATEAELIQLFTTGRIDKTSAINGMRLLGYDDGTAVTKFNAGLAALEKNEMNSYVSFITTKAIAKEIDFAEYQSLLDQTFLTDGEKKWLIAKVNVELQHPARLASLAEMKQFFLDAIISLEDFQAFLIQRKYTPDEQLWIVQEMLLSMDKAKQPKPAKNLSLSELRKALKASVITDQQFKDGLKKLGYSDDSIAILVTEATAGT